MRLHSASDVAAILVLAGEQVWRNGKPHVNDLIRFSDALRDHFHARATALDKLDAATKLYAAPDTDTPK